MPGASDYPGPEVGSEMLVQCRQRRYPIAERYKPRPFCATASGSW